ncbi:hypothetical protein [Streptomyces sp. NPDC091209]|uniref:hypothetical protein n=1 Tax=Streptomyces sp. NPDC091209 TaxID=3365974 RepID=UPI00380B9DE5
MAGRLGRWTFVYDDSGYTFDGTAGALAADGRTAVTTVHIIDGHARLAYATNDEEIEEIVPRRSRCEKGSSQHARRAELSFRGGGRRRVRSSNAGTSTV